jgi:hypothetical protein
MARSSIAARRAPPPTKLDLRNLPAPVFTPVDGTTQAVAALVYLIVGVGGWLRAPRDIRTRVFLAFSLANVVVFGIPTVWWLRGTTDPTKLPVVAAATIMSALGVGALLLFHFTQVFPRRRPWIQSSGIQMGVAYVLAPLTIATLVRFVPDSVAKLTTSYTLVFLVFGFPLLVLLGIVLPVAAIVSLLRSHRDLQRVGPDGLKRPIEWILISQIAGGTLAVVFAPVLAVVAPNGILQSILTLATFAFGLLTPAAYAAAIWRYGLLDVDPEQPPVDSVS